jgi:hypothetical protein
MFETVTGPGGGYSVAVREMRPLKRFHIVPLQAHDRLFEDYGKVLPDGRCSVGGLSVAAGLLK